MNSFKGMGVALVTPFNSEGDVDYTSLREIVEYQITSGADFLAVLCTTAETPTLSPEEKNKIKKFVLSTVHGRVPIVLGCGGNNTREIVKELKTRDWTGIDGILSVVPYYNKPNQEGLFRHFSAIAEASPLPILLYNVPGRVGVNMATETTLKLAHKYKNIVGIKEASGNFDQIDEIIKNRPKGFVVLSGDDSITYPLITMGAEGVISVIGNAYPKEFSQMVHLALSGQFEAALPIHRMFKELFSLLFVDGNPAGVKALLHAMGMCENVLRLPLVPTRIKTFKQIQNIQLKLSHIA